MHCVCVLEIVWASQYVHVCWCLCGHHNMFMYVCVLVCACVSTTVCWCVCVLVLVWAPQYIHVYVCVFGKVDLCAIHMLVGVYQK